MLGYTSRITCFKNAKVRLKEVSEGRITSAIDLDGEVFDLIFSYSEKIPRVDDNLAGLISLMPLINFSLFINEIQLDFPAEKVDHEFLSRMIEINNTEVFVNKICRRRFEFYKKEYLPKDDEITIDNARGNTRLSYTDREEYNRKYESNRTGILLSGGKESLTTFGMLNETGFKPDALFYNESGAHWFPAIPSYRKMKENNVAFKVWANTDRFYRWVFKRMKVLDQKVVSKVADTYPVQLFVFPVYLLALLPLTMAREIGTVFMGNEFDDPREMTPFRGIKHYYGIYDQTEDFEKEFNSYLLSKGIGIRLMSGVYPVSATKVEEILVKRYHDLFVLQRSCHSSRIIKGQVIPCGKCSKCIGVISLILAAGGDPGEINYSKEAIEAAKESLGTDRIRLDRDEVAYLHAIINGKLPGPEKQIQGIHVLPGERLPFQRLDPDFREKIQSIVEKYTTGIYRLDNGKWIMS